MRLMKDKKSLHERDERRSRITYESNEGRGFISDEEPEGNEKLYSSYTGGRQRYEDAGIDRGSDSQADAHAERQTYDPMAD